MAGASFVKHLSTDAFFSSLRAKAYQTRSHERVTSELTYKCNLRCVHCYNPTHRALPQELSTHEVLFILDQIADLGVVHLTFTGGELLLRPDVFDILLYAKRLGFLLSLLSNATRITPAVAEALQKIGCDSLHISIYGATKTAYERVTGIPSSFDRFIRGLESLRSRAIPVVVRMPVMTENAQEVQAARTLVERYGFKFQYCLDIMPKTNGDISPLSHRLRPMDKVRMNQAMVGYVNARQADSSCLATRISFPAPVVATRSPSRPTAK